MNTTKAEIESIYQLIEKAVLGENSPNDAIRVTTEFVDKNPDDADANYLAGYALYSLSNNQGSDGKLQIEGYLNRAISIDSKHAFAQMYLGHYYYDSGRYVSALDSFSEVDIGRLPEAGRSWREAKMAELVLCCKLRTTPSLVTAIEIQRLGRKYSAIDQESLPDLQELAETLISVNDDISNEIRSRIVSFLLKSDFRNILLERFPKIGEIARELTQSM